MTEDRKQMTDDGKKMTEDGKWKADLVSPLPFPPSPFDITLINIIFPTDLGIIKYYYVPVGVLSLASFLEENGFSAEILDYQHAVHPQLEKPESYYEFLLKAKSDIIGISVMAKDMPGVIIACEMLKNKHPHKIIILGGPGPTGVARRLMEEFPFIDFIVRGEGEYTLLELMKVEAGGCRRDVPIPINGGQRSEVGGQRSEVGGQMSEVGGQMSEVRGQMSEVRGQMSEVGGQRSEVGGQRSEVGGQMSEVRGRRSEVGGCRRDVPVPINSENDTESDIFRNIKGLVYRKDSNVIVNPQRERIKNINNLPLPAYHLINPKKYNMIYISSTRGCRHFCTFCDQPALWQGKEISRSPDSVFNEIDYITGELNAKWEIAFSDNEFYADKESFREFCRRYRDGGYKFIFSMDRRIDSIDEDFLKAASEVNCRLILYGVESGSDRILREIRKGFKSESIKPSLLMSAKYIDNNIASFMFNYPFEELQDFIATLNIIYSLWRKPTENFITLQLHYLSPLPRTPIFEKYRDMLVRRNVSNLMISGKNEMQYEQVVDNEKKKVAVLAKVLTEDGGRRSEVGSQRSEVGGQKSEVGGQNCRRDVPIPINGGQRSEDRGQRSEVGGQRSEVGGQNCRRDVPIPINGNRGTDPISHFPFPISHFQVDTLVDMYPDIFVPYYIYKSPDLDVKEHILKCLYVALEIDLQNVLFKYGDNFIYFGKKEIKFVGKFDEKRADTVYFKLTRNFFDKPEKLLNFLKNKGNEKEILFSVDLEGVPENRDTGEKIYRFLEDLRLEGFKLKLLSHIPRKYLRFMKYIKMESQFNMPADPESAHDFFYIEEKGRVCTFDGRKMGYVWEYENRTEINKSVKRKAGGGK